MPIKPENRARKTREAKVGQGAMDL